MKPALLALCLALLPGAIITAAPPQPNILYFYVDDMGWGSIGPNCQAERKAANLPYVRTPNLDRLAAAGVNFSRGYGCHVCSPARSSQQTGFHQGHTWADRNDPNNAKKAIRTADLTMGDVLSAAGYTTGYWGKWGYGGSKDQENPTLDNIQTLPTSHGYQYVLAELHHVRAHTFFQPTLWSAPAVPGTTGGLELVPNSMAAYQGKATYPNLPANQNHRQYPKVGYCDDAYAFAALDFVRKNGQEYNKTGKPFFGLLAVQIPHAPFAEIQKLPKWDQAYAGDPHFPNLAPQSQQWAAMVTRIDAHFGNILAALEDPNNDGDTSDSVADNTLVVFQSDNGGPGGKNNVELDANGGLRGTKGSIQEGGIRVPLVMRWPAKINSSSKLKAGTDCDMVVDVTDLFPTFCDIGGASTPVGLDGVSIAPTLTGQGSQRVREFLIHEAGNGQSIIRGKRKLVRSSGKKQKNVTFELYDLEADHSEENNLAKSHPELVAELKDLLLGERVAEPKGFANTYHHWTGMNGANTADAGKWSDYKYANAGVTYLDERGPPQRSWTARIENKRNTPITARAKTDLDVLSLEIRGVSESAPQTLEVGPGATVTGRNEIRVGAHGRLSLSGSSVSSLRWLEIEPGGLLEGDAGSVEADLYNHGIINAAGIVVRGDYHEIPGATLNFAKGGNKGEPLIVRGEAELAGTLAVTFAPDAVKPFSLIRANGIHGKFSNPGDEVVAEDGTRYSIAYSDTTVTLTAK